MTCTLANPKNPNRVDPANRARARTLELRTRMFQIKSTTMSFQLKLWTEHERRLSSGTCFLHIMKPKLNDNREVIIVATCKITANDRKERRWVSTSKRTCPEENFGNGTSSTCQAVWGKVCFFWWKQCCHIGQAGRGDLCCWNKCCAGAVLHCCNNEHSLWIFGGTIAFHKDSAQKLLVQVNSASQVILTQMTTNDKQTWSNRGRIIWWQSHNVELQNQLGARLHHRFESLPCLEKLPSFEEIISVQLFLNTQPTTGNWQDKKQEQWWRDENKCKKTPLCLTIAAVVNRQHNVSDDIRDSQDNTDPQKDLVL